MYYWAVHRSALYGRIVLLAATLASGVIVWGQTPTINSNGVVNDATMSASGGIAPGSVAALFGNNLASSAATASALPLPTTLGGTGVFINGIAAPLFFVSPTQINFQVPWELAGQGTNGTLIVNRNGTQSAPYTVSFPAVAPGIFTANGSGSGAGHILHSDFSLVSSTSPALSGETVIVLCTGLGPVSPSVASGSAEPSSVLATVSGVTAFLNGLPMSVTFAGLAPGSVGYYLVDTVVPYNVAGTFTLQIAASGTYANSVQISVTNVGTTLSLVAGATVNGASFALATAANGPIAPGAIVSIFGSNLASSVGKYLSAPLSTTLNGASVSFNGVAAPLFYVSPSQVNAQVPYSVVPGTGTVSFTRGSSILSRAISIASVSPGLFTVSQNGSGAGIALHANGSLVSPTNPAFPGESLAVMGNGFGPPSTPVREGTPSPGNPVATVGTPLANVGGVLALVTFSGLVPGFIGVSQFNLQVPVGLPTSSGTPLQAILNGVSSNTVTLSVLASGGTISVPSLSGLPGTSVSVPVTLTLGSGVAADSVTFTFVITSGTGAPALAGSLSFVQGAGMPAPSSTNTSVANTITVGWTGLSPARAGTVLLGNVLMPISASATGKSYTIQINSPSASLGAGPLNILPGATASLQLPAGFVSIGNASASPGGTARIPLTLSLSPGVTLDSIAFGLRLDPDTGAPPIAGPLTFQKDAALPDPSQNDNGAGPNVISISFLSQSTAFGGTSHLGDIVTTLPNTVLVGQAYTASLTAVSGSLASFAVALGQGAPALLSVNATYLVGDVFPVTSDYAGNFGDGSINTLDLIFTLRAVTRIPGFYPATCSDRFDAMDSFPLDAGNQRGGDGVLNTLDLIETLKRELKLTSIVISHDIPSALLLADKIAFLHQGQIVFWGEPHAFRQSQHPAIKAFLDAEQRTIAAFQV